MSRLPGTPKTGGAIKGVSKHKVDYEFRATVQRLLADNQDNVALWLRRVANGTLRTMADGSVRGQAGDPGRALDLLTKIAEYAAPRLSRAEVTPHPSERASSHIRIEFVSAQPAQLATPAPALQAPRADVIEAEVRPTPQEERIERPAALERYARSRERDSSD